jgi:hypothetical protein
MEKCFLTLFGEMLVEEFARTFFFKTNVRRYSRRNSQVRKFGIFGLLCTNGKNAVDPQDPKAFVLPAASYKESFGDPFESDKEVIWMGNLGTNSLLENQKRILEHRKKVFENNFPETQGNVFEKSFSGKTL